MKVVAWAATASTSVLGFRGYTFHATVNTLLHYQDQLTLTPKVNCVLLELVAFTFHEKSCAALCCAALCCVVCRELVVMRRVLCCAVYMCNVIVG